MALPAIHAGGLLVVILDPALFAQARSVLRRDVRHVPGGRLPRAVGADHAAEIVIAILVLAGAKRPAGSMGARRRRGRCGEGNDYRPVAALQYRAGALAIRFFGTHGEYDGIDAETV